MALKELPSRTQTSKEAPIPLLFSQTLSKRYQNPNMQELIKEMTPEIGIIDILPICYSHAEALLQTLAWESTLNFGKVVDAFEIGDASLLYFRDELTETPGLDEARKLFEDSIIPILRGNPAHHLRTYLPNY